MEQWAREVGLHTLGGSEAGIALEIPFGRDDTALARLLTTERHPTLGSGLLTTLRVRLPAARNQRTLAGVAADLNWLESDRAESLNQLGAWHEKDGFLVHALFIPNALYLQGLSLLIAQGQFHRAVWMDLLLNDSGDMEVRAAADIVYERTFGSTEWGAAVDA